MTEQADTGTYSRAADEATLPNAPMAMPEQQLERRPYVSGLALLLPCLVWSRDRLR